MVEKGFYKRLFILAIPIALQNIITFAVGLTDNIMVGTLGEVSISAVYLCNQIQVILQMLVSGIGAALIVLAAQYWGRNDKDSVKSIISISLKIAVCCAVVFFTLVYFFTRPVLSLFTNDRGVIEEAVNYAKVICFTYVLFCISSVINAALRCVGTVKVGLYLTILSFFLNVGLNWIFIFGNLGAPALGVKGAAIATLVSRIVEFCCLLIYIRFKDKKICLKFTELYSTNMVLVKDYFRYGLPVIMGDVFWGINLAVQGGIVGRLGADSIAGVSIANTIFSIFSVGVYGIANASAIIIGNTVGEGDRKKIKEYSKRLQLVFLAGGLITGMILFLSKDMVLMAYQVSPQTIDIASALLTVLSVTVVGTAYQMSTLTGIVRAGGATSFVLINDLIFVWIIVIPLSMLMAFVVKGPTWLVFLCLKCDQILKCGVAVVKVNRYNWIKKLTKEFET